MAEPMRVHRRRGWALAAQESIAVILFELANSAIQTLDGMQVKKGLVPGCRFISPLHVSNLLVRRCKEITKIS